MYVISLTHLCYGLPLFHFLASNPLFIVFSTTFSLLTWPEYLNLAHFAKLQSECCCKHHSFNADALAIFLLYLTEITRIIFSGTFLF